jgi:adenylate cyclase
MFTDMVGYTALGQRNESLALALVEEQRKLIRPILTRHDGKEVKTIGDAFLVEFPNAIDAVRCAFDIQRAIREFNISLEQDKRIHLRIGVHVGEVVESHGDISGDAVNVASRIEPLAEDGGVCLTRQVYDHVQNKVDLVMTSLGSRLLKNVAVPIEVFRMVMPWEKEKTEKAPDLNPKRIVVLPFVSMSPDPNDEYFADGLTEELITRVSLVQGLEVIARTSAMNYKKEKKSASQIGRELNVGTLLEGSVRKAGNKIRVGAQLISASTEGHLWAENYDRDLNDIFEVQSSVAENVAGALKLRLLDEEKERSTSNLEAYTLYLRATQLSHEGSETDHRRAIALFEEAITKDPKFVRAYAGLAQTLRLLAGHSDYTSTLGKAESFALKALELDPESAEAHAAMAAVCLGKDNFERGRFEMERAVQINPNLAQGHYSLGENACTFGRLDEGLAHFEKAFALDPLSVAVGTVYCNSLRGAGRVEKAIEVLRRLEVIHPKSEGVYDVLATCYIHAKDFAKASESIDIGLRASPDSTAIRIDRGCLYALLGRRKEAEDEIRELSRGRSETTRANAQFFIRAALGDFDEAFEALFRQAELHSWYYLVKYDSIAFLEELRTDSRFSEFCMKVGLPI